MALEHLRRLALAVLACAAIATGGFAASIAVATLTPAVAQISEDAQIALEQYGAWRPHPRFGEVWVPASVPPDWRPYQYGHWVYTDDWGWYWVSDDVEADWGWVVYHYGRWVFEREFGWFWVPGDEWAPAWVNWRYGDDYIGWAPLPPDELIDAYEVEPAYWLFVPGRYLAAPRLRGYYVPVYRQSVILRATRPVNRTFGVRGQRLAVNPGISPAFVARVSGAPLATYRVRPRVFASTQGVAGAVPIRREDLRAARGAGRPPGAGSPQGRPGGGATRLGAVSVQRTNAVVQPSAAAAAPQPLNKNEPGRLGTHPPRAAQGLAPVAPAGTPPAGQQRQLPAVQQQQAPAAAPAPAAPATPAPTPAPAATPTPSTTPAPATSPTPRREERRGPGGPPPQQPNIVRPIPPQATPPSPPPPQEQRRAPPPPQEQRRAPPPPQAPPPPPPQQRVAPPPQPPKPPAAPAVRPPPPPPPAARPAPPPAAPKQAPPPPAKKPPPKPGEKPEEKK